MNGNNLTVITIVGMVLLTVLFASWVGAVSGDPVGGGTSVGYPTDTDPTDPTTELLCPRMKDRPCTASGTFASANPAVALAKAIDRCTTEYEKCVVNQESESQLNMSRCNSVKKCEYDHGTVNKTCTGSVAGNCTTNNGFTSCTVKGEFDRTTYKCEKPVETPDASV